MGVGSQTDGAIGTRPLHGQGTGTNVDPLLPFDPPLPLDPFGLVMGARQVHCPGETLLPLLPLLPDERDPLLPLLPEEKDPLEEPEGTRQVHDAEPLDPDGTKPNPLEPLGPLPDGPLNDPLLPEGATPHPFDPLGPLPEGPLNDPLLPEGPTPLDLLPDGPLNEPLLPPEPEGDPFADVPPLGGAGTNIPGVVGPFHPSAIQPSLRH